MNQAARTGLLLLLVCLVGPAIAVPRDYLREYRYQATEHDSPRTARIMALDGVRQLLLAELGTFIRSEISNRVNQDGLVSARHDVSAVTAGLVRMSVLEERWDARSYYVKANITADPDAVLAAVERLRADEELAETLERTRSALAAARSELDRLREAHGGADGYRAAVDRVDRENRLMGAVRAINAGQYFEAGLTLMALAEAGSGEARYELGRMYQRGLGTQVDLARARELYDQAIAAGHARAASALGFLYNRGAGVDQDFARARALYQQAIDAGDGRARVMLGRLYERGEGVARDVGRAHDLYARAAAQGYPKGMVSVANLLLHGDLGRKQPRKAMQLYREAAELGSAEALARLGMLHMGRKFRDPHKACRYFQAAERGGNLLGMSLLGYCHAEGIGMPENPRRAFELFQAAARAGSGIAQYQLARAYAKGQGTPVDPESADYWMQRWRANGGRRPGWLD